MKDLRFKIKDLRLIKGFTLIEILVYIAILGIVILAVSSFLIWSIRSNAKAQAMREVLDGSQRAMEIMTYEIREAENIYTPTSVFGTNPGQLSLETTHNLPAGENTTYVDFYVSDSRFCLKRESQNPLCLTSENVTVSNLVFTRIVTGNQESVQINLTVEYVNPSGRPEYQASTSLQTTVSLR